MYLHEGNCTTAVMSVGTLQYVRIISYLLSCLKLIIIGQDPCLDHG